MAPKWSFLAYIAGDNDLSTAADEDLDQIRTADSSKVNVVVQIDKPTVNTQRLVLRNNKLNQIPAALRPAAVNVNAGDAAALTDFLNAAKDFLETKYTAVIIGSHGTGFRDFTFARLGDVTTSSRSVLKTLTRSATSMFKTTIDKTIRKAIDQGVQALSLAPDDSAQDFLDNLELETAFRDSMNGGAPFDIIGCDACLMGMVEVAYQLRKVGRYFVASQEDESKDGWPYDTVLAEFNESTSPRKAAQGIVGAYAAATATDREATLSAVDLRVMEHLAAALDELGAALLPVVSKQIDLLTDARSVARDFADYDYIDLFGFVKAVKRAFSDPSIDSLASHILDLIDKAVIATSEAPLKSGAHGLSIYLPNAPVTSEYHDLALSANAPNWHDFVVAYGSEFQGLIT